MKTAEEKTFDDKIESVDLEELMYDEFHKLIAEAKNVGKEIGRTVAMKWRDAKKQLPNKSTFDESEIVLTRTALKDGEVVYNIAFYNYKIYGWFDYNVGYELIPNEWRPIE